MSETQRVAVIGLDGATYDILEPLIQGGYLPHIKKFFHHGARGRLISTVPPVTAAAWTSFATGLNPGRTGIFDFWNRRAEGWQMKPMASSDLAGKAFWDLAGDVGHRVIVYNYPMLYPAYPVNGVLAGGVGSSLDDRLTYPTELFQTLNKLCGGYEVSIYFNNPRYTNHPDLFVKHTVQLLGMNEKAIEYLLRKEEWDLFVCVLSATDFAQHFLWKYIDPFHRDYNEECAEAMQRGFRQIWQQVDGIVGRIVEICGAATDIILMSDHGFGPEEQVFYVNNWLDEHGYLVRQSRGGGVWRSYPWLRQLARATIGGWFPDLFELIRKRRMTQIRFDSVVSQVDMARTKAIALGSTASGAIYINPVACPDLLYEETREEIRTALQNLATELGEEIRVEAHLREEIYTGEKLKWAPDIVFSMNDYRCAVIDAFSTEQVFVSRCWSPNKSGSHRAEGVLMASGPRIQPARLVDINILDLAPTILYLLNIPIPSDLDGRLIMNIISDQYVREHAVQYGQKLGEKKTGEYDRGDEEAIIERLRGLGYL